ncbi:hypothetical protein FK521_30150, partial [Klebsiella pneumoniae]|nr:hypothetical protein [Klebsiella pneumoniae]
GLPPGKTACLPTPVVDNERGSATFPVAPAAVIPAIVLKNDLQGATLAIVPGDPERVEKIAALMDKPVKLVTEPSKKPPCRVVFSFTRNDTIQ